MNSKVPQSHKLTNSLASFVNRITRYESYRKAVAKLRKFSKWYTRQYLVPLGVRKIPVIGLDIHDVLVKSAGSCLPTDQYSELLESAFRADEFILKTTRQMSAEAGRKELYEAYEKLIEAKARDEEIVIGDLLSYLEDVKASQFNRDNILAPHLTVECGQASNNRISSITYLAGKNRLLHLDEALLLWDCACSVRELSVSGKKHEVDESKCPIHRNRKIGDELSKLFEDGLAEIRYNDVKVLWKQKRELWPPSIDAFNMVEDLRRDGILDQKPGSVIDIGSGTGFLGVWLAKKIPSIRKAIFTDWLISPLILSALNASRNLDDTHVNRQFLLGLDINWFGETGSEDVFDLLVCNPPYLPSLSGFNKLPLNSAVFGTDLLVNIIANAKQKARRAYISFSNLAQVEADEACERTGTQLVPVSAPHRVPFRVAQIYGEDAYIRRLIDERGLQYLPNERYPLWHEVRTYRIV